MTFVSTDYAIFFLVVFATYLCLRHKQQNLFLLAASYLFYGWWDYRFLLLLFGTSVIDFYIGSLVSPVLNNTTVKRRRWILTLSIILNLGVLGFFKYYNFFLDTLAAVLPLGEISLFSLKVILPVGISFYTFQSMSYTIDCYRGRISPLTSLPDFLLYVSFFPQLVAGPIERAETLTMQIREPRLVSGEKITTGVYLIIVGLVKKLVIADSLGEIAQLAFNTKEAGGVSLLIGVYAFSFQIYGDFSGYSDIARGSARILGFELMENFRFPYFAKSPSEFWQRWHISLSTWLRDYLYIPLGGNRGGSIATARNLMITMVLGGLWHGAAGHFVLWGLYHGLLLCIWRFTPWPARLQLPGIVRTILFFHLVAISWLLFRVESVESMFHLLSLAALDPFGLGAVGDYWRQVLLYGLGWLALERVWWSEGSSEAWRNYPSSLRTVLMFVLLLTVVLFGSPIRHEFIYFQF